MAIDTIRYRPRGSGVSGDAMGRLEDQDELWRLDADEAPGTGAGADVPATTPEDDAPSFKDELNLAEFRGADGPGS